MAVAQQEKQFIIMKKLTFILMTSTIIFASCGSKSTASKDKDMFTKTSQTIIHEEDSLDQTIPKDVAEFIDLYTELTRFKDKNDFKRLGFGQGSPYKNWYNRANTLTSTAKLPHFTKYGIVPGDIVALGNAYVASAGKENVTTKALNEAIKKGIDKANGNENRIATSIKKDLPNGNETVIGHWKLSGALNMDIKIIKINQTYYSIENGKTIKLTRKGDKYFQENSKTGEYYKIKDGKLRLCDKDGDFTDLFKINITTLE